jgi:hypothetical protein
MHTDLVHTSFHDLLSRSDFGREAMVIGSACGRSCTDQRFRDVEVLQGDTGTVEHRDLVIEAASECALFDDVANRCHLKQASFNLVAHVLELADLDGLGRQVAEQACPREQLARQLVLAWCVRPMLTTCVPGPTQSASNSGPREGVAVTTMPAARTASSAERARAFRPRPVTHSRKASRRGEGRATTSTDSICRMRASAMTSNSE